MIPLLSRALVSLPGLPRLARRIVPGRSGLAEARALVERLTGSNADVQSVALAGAYFACFAELDEADRLSLFQFLAEDLGPDRPLLLDAARAYVDDPSTGNAARLTERSEPARQRLLRRLNGAPGGTAMIVEMRRSVLGLLGRHPDLAPLAEDMKHLLSSWFNRGFLQMRRIDWNTPAVQLEKLIEYEAVHPIAGWDALKRRLQEDRRCFGFFHPSLPSEPLIFVEIALTNGMSDAIAPLIEDDAPKGPARPGTAIFYSISNCQPGLRNIAFGNFLIKQVAAELRAELPSLKRFATLSPIPGFRRWLDRSGAAAELSQAEREALEHPGWWHDDAAAAMLRPRLRRLCAQYLTGDHPLCDGVRDSVARFHLGNGARLERINWLADLSAKGIAESAGMMVNYVYEDRSINRNSDQFLASGTVATSREIRSVIEKPA